MKIGALAVYPVKSGRGMAVDRWPLDARGLAHDREYMVVDPRALSSPSVKPLDWR